MIATNLNSMAPLSYTNKDFESIYPELLDLVKILTAKWDPSISNESDPGVILLKLNAIIADKCNYNSDKNVLECFPSSVSQDSNARKLFAQLGYFMNWYRSAFTDVTMRWSAAVQDYQYTIPAFTMVANSDKSIVYTLLGPSAGKDNDIFNVSDYQLPCDGNNIVFKAIQGIAVNYTINGERLITADYLDDQNRLYFDSLDIAQNGIFITNSDNQNYSSWIRKDNLIAESLNNTYYKFGISDDGSSCYIEFPLDVERVFQNGIYITYIKTLGRDGNIKAGELSQFYNDINVQDQSGNNSTLNSDNVYIFNPSSATNGRDVESINSAYRNYQRTIGTFNTLVTLRDYINYVLRSGLVSNGFVCDRTNDIQSTYNIITSVNNINQQQTYIVRDDDGKPELTAFSLKLYLLQYVENVSDYSTFSKTFDPLSTAQLDNVKLYISDVKSIQHDYADFLTADKNSANILYFKNRFPVNCTIIPQYQLNNVEVAEVRKNIKDSLYLALNAKEIDFGQDISYDLLYDTIMNSDARIKSVSLPLDGITYQTYAVYFDGKDFKEVNISDASSLFDIKVPDYLQVSVKRPIFEAKQGVLNYESITFEYNNGWKLDNKTVSLSDYGITCTGTPKTNDQIIISPTYALRIREEIYVKSVLAGVTQFFVNDEPFDYRFDQGLMDGKQTPVIVDGIEKLSSEVKITLDNNSPQYTLRDNETIQLYSPNLVDVASYSDYVKYEYNLKSPIQAKQARLLEADEYIILYWKTDSGSTSVYKYAVYGQGNIIMPTFKMPKTESTSSIVGISLVNLMQNVGTPTNIIRYASSEQNGDMDLQLSNRVGEMPVSTILSGTNKITVKRENRITLDESYRCYWIMNNVEDGKYYLHHKSTNGGPTTRMLNVGEYFLYTDVARSDLVILGAGTQITISNPNVDYSVDAIDSSYVLENGVDSLEDYWFVLQKGDTFTLLETYYMNISSGCVFSLQPNITYSKWSAKFDGSSVGFTGGPKSLSDFTIKYKQSSLDEDWITVEQISLSNNSGWQGRSLLGIDVADDAEQILYANQSITYYTHDDQKSFTLEGADYDKTSQSYPVCFQSTVPISLNGAEQLIVSYEEEEQTKYPSLYFYRKYVSPAFEDVTYSNGGDVTIAFEATTSAQQRSFNFMLPEGDYVLKVFNGFATIVNANIQLDGVDLKYVSDSSLSSVAAKGSYYLKMTIDNSNNAEHIITVSLKNSQAAQCNLTLSNPYKYTMPQEFFDKGNFNGEGDVMFDNICSMISKFDPQGLYDYTYKVSDEVAIEDPVEPGSFMNVNHIYNPFTICQLDMLYDKNISFVGKK